MCYNDPGFGAIRFLSHRMEKTRHMEIRLRLDGNRSLTLLALTKEGT